MKLLKLIFAIVFILIPSISFAARWYNLSGTLSWSTASWYRSCPTWMELLVLSKNKAQPRSWTAKCYYSDNEWPTIMTTWFNDNQWVNTESVTVNVTISDAKSWVDLNNIKYSINWEDHIWSDSFSINLNEEWYYNIIIEAYDKAYINWNTGLAETLWNKSTKNIIIKIDNSDPNIYDYINPLNWFNEKPTVNFNIDDRYKWINIKNKTFECNIKPEFSHFIYPVNNWEINWTCIENEWWPNCNLDINYTPNQENCNWECDEWYVLVWDQCISKTETYNCNEWIFELPSELYYYDTTNFIQKYDTSANQNEIYWNNPIWVWYDWSYLANYNIDLWTYSPTINQCDYECSWSYHRETNKCIDNTKIICCDEPYLANTWGWWTTIDCSLPENQTSVECSQSSICWWQKEVLWEWDLENSIWNYTTTTDWTKIWEEWRWELCWFSYFENSDWETCNPRYYLDKLENWIPIECLSVPVWEYSWQDNDKYSCNNKPSNSYYISNGISNDCDWTCDEWYSYKIDRRWNESCEKKINWKCWIADWWAYDWFPSNEDLCSEWFAWNKIEKFRRDELSWKCYWIWGWRDVSCKADLIDISCWTSDWKTFTETPTNNLCDNWTLNWIDNTWDDWYYNWECLWIDSSNDVSCNALRDYNWQNVACMDAIEEGWQFWCQVKQNCKYWNNLGVLFNPWDSAYCAAFDVYCWSAKCY